MCCGNVGLGSVEIVKEEGLERVRNCEAITCFLHQPPLSGIEGFMHVLKEREEGCGFLVRLFKEVKEDI